MRNVYRSSKYLQIIVSEDFMNEGDRQQSHLHHQHLRDLGKCAAKLIRHTPHLIFQLHESRTSEKLSTAKRQLIQ